MQLTEYKLGSLIELSLESNSDLQFSESDVMGMTITKEIISTKANTEGADLSKYLLVRPNEFVYNPRTHGKKIGLGYNNTDKTFIISWNNIAFRVADKAKNILLSDYLFTYFKRDEWDRMACFSSWGSSTEVFSWDTLCDMDITLPSLPTQQKAVDAYNAINANLTAYTDGIADLKTTCQAYIEKLAKEYLLEEIGEYIEPCFETNYNEIYGLESLKGISIQKCFIETKANMENVSLKPYILVEPDAFAFVPTTSRNGDKITIALNHSSETCIVSSSYEVFNVKNAEILVPEYLFLWLSRPEFDRYARYNSWGSAREVFTYTDMCMVKIPIPPKDIQQSIVDIYHAQYERQEIADTLNKTLREICPVLISHSLALVQ